MNNVKDTVCCNIACNNCYERECMAGRAIAKQCLYCVTPNSASSKSTSEARKTLNSSQR